MSSVAVPKPILVAFDGSRPARAAASVALQIAAGEGLAIRGLYVIDTALVMDPYANCQLELGKSPERASRAELIADFQRRGEQELTWLADRCRTTSVPVTTAVLMGSVAMVVLQEATQATLLTLGRCGHGHATDGTHLGRHFRAIAHHAPCPLVVGGDQERALQRILLAIDGGEHAGEALEWATRLQRSLQAEVFLLTVRQPGSKTADEPREHLSHEYPLRYRLLTREGEPAAEIVAAATENQADCILMGGYRHTAVVEWLVGSVVEGVLAQTPLPVLLA
jgi:nucleotide-binding universal stress UspA family protein